MLRTFCLTLLCLTLAGAAAGQPTPTEQAMAGSIFADASFTDEAEDGLAYLYNLQFPEASAVFTRLARRYPEHPAIPFLKGLETWWRIMLDLGETTHDRQFLREMEQVIRLADRRLRRNKKDIDGMFFKGAALGFRGRLHSNRRNYFAAFQDSKRAMDYVLGVARLAPENNDFYFGWGIYDYFAETVPKNYPLLRPFMLLFPKGDRLRGLEELNRVVERGRFIRAEAAYFLTQIYYVIEEDYTRSAGYVTWLRARYPDNAFYHTLEGRIQARWSRWDQAVPLFQEVLRRWEQHRVGYNDATAEQALYYLGRHAMIYGKPQDALAHLDRLHRIPSRQQKRDAVFRVMGRLRQGMCYDLLGRRQEAQRAYRDVLAAKNWHDAHDQARRYLRQPYDAARG
jgi:tetratricopeptide (TPR) repeat protein